MSEVMQTTVATGSGPLLENRRTQNSSPEMFVIDCTPSGDNMRLSTQKRFQF